MSYDGSIHTRKKVFYVDTQKATYLQAQNITVLLVFLKEKNDVEKNINSLGFAFQMYLVIMFETQFKTF